MTTDTETPVAVTEPAEAPADSDSRLRPDSVSDRPPAEPLSPHEKVSRILSMKVPVIVKIAQKKMTVSEILKLRLGSVIQFDKDPYQNIDLMVNNSVIGAGQPIKVNETFGLKIVQIGALTDTIKSLGGNSPS